MKTRTILLLASLVSFFVSCEPSGPDYRGTYNVVVEEYNENASIDTTYQALIHVTGSPADVTIEGMESGGTFHLEVNGNKATCDFGSGACSQYHAVFINDSIWVGHFGYCGNNFSLTYSGVKL